jgi:hypothetical protein
VEPSEESSDHSVSTAHVAVLITNVACIWFVPHVSVTGGYCTLNMLTSKLMPLQPSSLV